MTDNSFFTKPRKTLRQSLKDLLRLRLGRSANKDDGTIGSGILRKADSSQAYQLPQFSGVSLFPDFETSAFDFRRYAAHNQAQQHLPVPTSVCQPRRKHGLLPATSLSQFDLSRTFAQHGEVKPQQVVYDTVSDGYLSGFSRQASLASLSPSILHKSTSTLRIRDSSQDLRSSARSPLPSDRIQKDAPKLRKKQSRIDSQLDLRSIRRPPQAASSAQSSTFSTSSRRRDPLTLIEHFRQFCVLDTTASGCPVTGTSSELRYIFDIGEDFFLANQKVEGTSMDIITGTDAAGNPVTNLVLFSPLIAPSSGRSRFMIASLIDVSPFIQETATLPELDTISEESSVASLAEVVATPSVHASPGWRTLSHEMSAEDLLGGCYLRDEDPSQKRGRPAAQDDIWLDLASSEKSDRGTARRNFRAPQSMYAPPTPSSTRSSSTASSVDDVLDTFVASLQRLYSNFFILGKSALDDNCYEICNVSPQVYDAKEYVDGHLSLTPRDTIESLSASLTQDKPFTIGVNWGRSGESKQLYCSPLYGQRSVTWICFLVDPSMSILW